MINTSDKTAEKSECEKLRQAILSFTGVLKLSDDPRVKEAAHVLYKQAKAVK